MKVLGKRYNPVTEKFQEVVEDADSLVLSVLLKHELVTRCHKCDKLMLNAHCKNIFGQPICEECS